MTIDDTPNPGSETARSRGCECPVIDNHYGRGFGPSGEPPRFVISGSCPVHHAEFDELKQEKGQEP